MFCKICGKEIEGNFCSNCGNSNQKNFEEARTQPEKPKKTWLVIAAIIFAVSVIFTMSGMETGSAIGSASFCGAITYLIFGIIKCAKKFSCKSMFIGMTVCIFLMIGSVNAEVKPKQTVEPIKTAAISSSHSNSQLEKSSQKEQTKTETMAGVGETLDYNGLKITLDSVTKYEDDSQFALDKTEPGNVFILLNFTATNETGKDDHINMFYEDSYCDDVSIDPENILYNAKGETIWGDIANGKKRKGYIAYEVPSDWKNIEFYYNPEVFGDESSKMMFKASANDLT